MAVTSVWRIKGNIGKVILYVENEDKTRSAEAFDNSKSSTETVDVLNEVLNYVSRDSATEEQVYVSVLNEIVDVLPELRVQLGKPQHRNHSYDVLQHSLKVMQKISQDPKYQELNEIREDKNEFFI